MRPPPISFVPEYKTPNCPGETPTVGLARCTSRLSLGNSVIVQGIGSELYLICINKSNSKYHSQKIPLLK